MLRALAPALAAATALLLCLPGALAIDQDDVLEDIRDEEFENDLSDLEDRLAENLDRDQQIGDVSLDVQRDRDRDTSFDFDDDNVLLGLALERNGWDLEDSDVRDVDASRDDSASLSYRFELERDDVFAALLLGDDFDFDFEPIDIANIDADSDRSVRYSSGSDFDEDTVFAAVATEDDGDARDVASSDESLSIGESRSSSVDYDRDTVLWSLVLRS